MWYGVVALAMHALSMVTLSSMVPRYTRAVWDFGHTLLPAIPAAAAVVEAVTVATPLAVLATTPRRERARTAARAAGMFAGLTVLRACLIFLTVLPALWDVDALGTHRRLLGHGFRDYIFSGHTALVASWLLAPFRPNALLMYAISSVHAVALLAARMHYTIDIVLAWVFAWLLYRPPPRLRIHFVDPVKRGDIYRARHEVYAEELGQYPESPTGELTDSTDAYNTYIVATRAGILQGFVAITPPGHRKALEKHGAQPVDPNSYEMRLLSVLPGARGQGIASALVHAAARYIVASGGRRLEGMARLELLPMYQALGASTVCDTIYTVGNVQYAHVVASLEDWVPTPPDDDRMVWDLPFPMHTRGACTHGGRGLESLNPANTHSGINADVLDAWFAPAPAIARELAAHVEADVKTTPPAGASELIEALSTTRGVDSRCFVLGAGSSDLIYRCFFLWLTPQSRVLLLDPTYAEYAHVLDTIGCEVVTLPLDDRWQVSSCLIPDDEGPFDLVILVNPNSPTGIYCETMLDVVKQFDFRTKVWVDETYMEYAGRQHSLERHVTTHANLIICKSMSKPYALSGLRVGYVCAHPMQLDTIRQRTPPWTVSRPAQRAAVLALEDESYYLEMYDKTHQIRESFIEWLDARGFEVVKGARANFVMCRPPAGVSARTVREVCARHHVHIRLVDDEWLRIAVTAPEVMPFVLTALDTAIGTTVI
jgi:histidinol-phosphate/aromatic aminotransferase/cobyric acid decarboxylase-like protein/GNAT superfamily N-acetyltransferase